MNGVLKSVLVAALTMQSMAASADVLDFGVAGKFNVFVFENFTSANTDVEGAVAVGGSLNVSSYSINEKNKAVAGNALVVAKNITFNGGSVKNGNIDVGGTSTTSSFGFTGAYTDSDPINFADQRTYLENLSISLNALSNTGTVGYAYSGIQLTASNSTSPQIFDIDGSIFNTKNNTTFTGFSYGQTVILNISGGSEIFNGGTGTDFANLGPNVVYNFYQATAVNTGSGAYGSILAPFADVVGGYTAINGNVIAKSWNNNTQVNVTGMFKPTDIPGLTVTPVPEPESYGMLLMGLGVVGLLVRRRKA
jgi:choice-of-anchor A domain-containing protein